MLVGNIETSREPDVSKVIAVSISGWAIWSMMINLDCQLSCIKKYLEISIPNPGCVCEGVSTGNSIRGKMLLNQGTGVKVDQVETRHPQPKDPFLPLYVHYEVMASSLTCVCSLAVQLGVKAKVAEPVSHRLSSTVYVGFLVSDSGVTNI